MKRVFLYVRVSTEEQAIHGLSIEAQTAALEEWAKSNGHQVVDIYTDAGISARKSAAKRPELQRLLADAQAGKGELIVFTKLDRWFRNIAEYYKVQEILERCKVDWRTIHEDYDTSTASGRLKINIMLSVAQDEADRTSERIKAVFDAKKERLEPCTGRVPTGYKVEGKKVIKDPETEAAVSYFFERFLDCRSITKARRDVEEKFRTCFPYSMINRMLHSEAYCGTFCGIDGMCPPYITREQFEEIAANRHHTERKVLENRTYLFTGLVYCSECGRRYGSRLNSYALRSGELRDWPFYSCRVRTVGRGCSNSVCVSENQLERYLLENIDVELERYACELARVASETAPRKNFQEERAVLRRKLSRLKDLYVDAIIDLDLYRRDYEALNAQLSALAAEEAAAAAPPPSADRLLSIFSEGWQELYSGLDRPDRQNFWRSAIDRIWVYPTRQITLSFRP